jgi:putative FmdB family regulatory protein
MLVSCSGRLILPLYEYRCLQCDAHFEKIQKFSDPPIKRCEICGGRLEQLLSSPAIQFKGSGWYITDYARKSSSETSSKGDGAASTKTESKSTKSESKPAEPKTTEPSKKT